MRRSSPRTSQWLVLTLAGSAAAILFTYQALVAVERAPQYARYEVYTRVDYWLKSARCSAETGTFLTVCQEGRTVPIENVDYADDHGHAFLLNVWSYFRATGLSKLDVVFLNYALNILGFVALAWGLYMAGLPLLSLACLPLLLSYGLPGPHPSADVSAAYPGIFCFALAPSFILLGLTTRPPEHLWRRVLGISIAVLSMALAVSLRSAIGTAGIVTLMGTGGLLALVYRRDVAWRQLVLACSLISSASLTPDILLTARNLMFRIPETTRITGHGFSHNLYIGLGVYENPWGIRWDDLSAFEAAKTVKSDVIYCSPEYFQILRKKYLQILLDSPVVVTRIYSKKFLAIMKFRTEALKKPLQYMRYGLFQAFIPVMAVIWIVMRRTISRTHVLSFILLVVAWYGMIIQGVLSLPWVGYVYPAEIAQGLLMTLWLGWGVGAIVGWRWPWFFPAGSGIR